MRTVEAARSVLSSPEKKKTKQYNKKTKNNQHRLTNALGELPFRTVLPAGKNNGEESSLYQEF